MVLLFNTTRNNKELLDKLLPKYPMVTKKGVEWVDLVEAELHILANLHSAFYKKTPTEKLPLILGYSTISFDELKVKMIEAAKSMLKEGKAIHKADYQSSKKELKEIKKIKKLTKELTEEAFVKLFRKEKNYRKLFPYLWRLELSLDDTLFPEIFNYLTHNKVQLFDRFSELKCEEEFTEIATFDEERLDLLKETREKTNRVTESLLVFVNTANANGMGIDTQMLVKNLDRKLNKTT
jgi:hypothetical protein